MKLKSTSCILKQHYELVTYVISSLSSSMTINYVRSVILQTTPAAGSTRVQAPGLLSYRQPVRLASEPAQLRLLKSRGTVLPASGLAV